LWDLFSLEENAARVVYLIPKCAIAPFKHRLKLFDIYDALAPNNERLLVRTLSKASVVRTSTRKVTSESTNILANAAL
jgi:hypothetical protein